MEPISATVPLGRRDQLTFKGNLNSTRYGWLRLTPAYSIHLVSELLDDHATDDAVVLDPFCGTGTTALVCAERGIACDTTDINPFLIWLTEAKTRIYTPDEIKAFCVAAERVAAAMDAHVDRPRWVPPLHRIERWWDAETLAALGHGMDAIREMEPLLCAGVADLLKLAFCRVMIESAQVSFGHQSMSFKQKAEESAPIGERGGRRKAETGDPIDTRVGADPCVRPGSMTEPSRFAPGRTHGSAPTNERWTHAVASIAHAARSPILSPPRALLCDARDLSAALPRDQYDRVITSPPYLNRMSYIRELRPYMYWLGYLQDGRQAGELDWQAIGGTWGCATSNVAKWTPDAGAELPVPGLADLPRDIARHSDLLSRYVHKYVADMAIHCRELARVVKPGGAIHYIVGNSKFYDVLLPVEAIFAALFAASGFVDVDTRVLRKRTSKKELFEYLVSARKPE